MLSELTAHIRKFTNLPEGAEAILAEYSEACTFRKKDFLFKTGQVCKGNYFIVKGCCRSFTVTEKDTELINHFAIENWWITDYFSLES